MSSIVQATSPTPSTSNIQLITDALADYAKETGIDLSKSPIAVAIERANSPAAILEVLQQREKAFKDYRERNRKLISCLTPAVNVIQAFSGILGQAVSLVPFPPANALFVGIDVLLSAASGVTSSYDALLNLFECLGNFFMRLEVYTTIPPTPLMTDLIVKIMVELLSVLALATKHIKQGRFKKFLKNLWQKDKIQDALGRLDRLTKDEGLSAVAQTLGVVHGISRVVMGDGKAPTGGIGLNSASNEIIDKKMKRDQLHKDVQHWLSPPDPSTNQNFVSRARHKGTAAWFFESSALTEWKMKGSLLWIHGKPGSGKSTLLSAIIQDVEAMHTAGLATMAYYYFDFRDIKKQDCYGLISSLLSQLSAESDSCYNAVSKLYSERGMRKPDVGVLKKCLADMLSLPGQGQIYIIVDALDECPNVQGTPTAREEVLEFVKEIVNLKLPNVNLCVASRPEMDIRLVLEPLTTLRISLHDEIGQKKDIVEYVNSIVRSDWRIRRWNEADKQLVVDTLSGKAEGMFRWVVCQVDRLRRTLPASIRNVLNDLPKTLDETYSRSLLCIDEENREYAQRLFRCLMVSIRPLRVNELAEILAVQFDKEEPPTFNTDWRPAYAEETIMFVCSSLVAIVDRGDHQVVQFSHFSVKEYLTSERLAAAEEHLSYYHILPESAHTTLAHASLSVLLHLDDKIDRDTIAHLPFAPYAAQHWVDHAQFRNVSSDIKMMKRLFDLAKPHFAAWVWLYDIDRYWSERMPTTHPTQPEAEPLYYASLCGFVGLAEHLIAAHSPDVNRRGGSHTTALHAASVKGHLEVASLLISNGGDPNSRDHLDRAPLHRVSQSGQLVMAKSSLEIARLLVNSGADVNATDYEGCAPLHAAAQSGYREIAELLLGSNATLDARNKKKETPMKLSCDYGKPDMAQFLIDCGSDLNSRDAKSFSLLHIAARCGHVDVAKLLIDRGANIDSRNNKQVTPLLLASYFGHLEVTRFLIEKGAALSAFDKDGYSPLHNASYGGHLPVMKLLLERGIDVDTRNGFGRTPFYVASRFGRLEVVRFLIERGANIHIVEDNDSDHPLHIASQNGHLDIVEVLIDVGTPVDIRDASQKTPLALASSKGKVEVARFLIHRGADPNVRDNQNQVSLHIASQYGHLDITRLLLEQGAHPNIKRNDLCSPLHVASANGHLNVAELLVQRGASINISNGKQETPLYQAVTNGNTAVVRLLMDHGAFVHTADSNGWTILHAASRHGHLGVVKLLLQRGADFDVLNKARKTAAELASENGQVKVAKFIAEYKANANTRNKLRSMTLDVIECGVDDDGNNEANVSLHAVAEEGSISTIMTLLERGMDINARNARDQTPLDRAAKKGDVDVIRLLIERGAEVDSRDKWGWTPLHRSTRHGHPETSRVLLDHGANVNARKRNNWTPMHLSAGNGYLETVKLLLERGADIHATNDRGETPYQVSWRLGCREVADLLRNNGADRVGESP